MQSLMEGDYVQPLLHAETHTFSKDYRTFCKVCKGPKPQKSSDINLLI